MSVIAMSPSFPHTVPLYTTLSIPFPMESWGNTSEGLLAIVYKYTAVRTNMTPGIAISVPLIYDTQQGKIWAAFATIKTVFTEKLHMPYIGSKAAIALGFGRMQSYAKGSRKYPHVVSAML